MGRFLTSGSAVSGTSAAPAVSTTMVVGEAVQQGDIITLGADSLGYAALDPSVPGATLRPLSSTATLLNGLQAPTTIIPGGTASQPGRLGFCLLNNGNFVIAWQATDGLSFAIYNSLGVPQGNPVFVESTGGQLLVRMTVLSGGGFALVYIAADLSPHYAVYDANGGVVKAGTQIESITGNVYTLAIAAVAGGGFVIGWYRVVSNIQQPRFARFNAAGVLQGSITQVEALPTNASPGADSMSIAALAGGGFVIAYQYYSTSTSSSKFGRYDAAGALQGQLTVYGATVNTPELGVFVCPLTDGGFAVAQYATASFAPSVAKYDANGAIVGAAFALGTVSGIGNSGVRIVALAGGGYAFTWAGTGAVLFAMFNALAVQIGKTSTVAATANVPLALTQLSDGGFAIGNGAAINGQVSRLDSAGAQVGVPTATGVAIAATNVFVAPLVQNIVPGAITFVMAFGQGTSVGFAIINASVQKMTLVGVASASAAKGSAVPVQIGGVATLRVGFNQPVSLNGQGNATPGQKMSVVGNTAILLGVQ